MKCPKLSPLSALGHISIRIRIFICDNPGCPNTWSLIHHSLKAEQGAKRDMRHGTGWRGGQQPVGQTQHPSCDSGILAKRGKNILFLQFFCGPHFCVKRDAPTLIFFAFFFADNNTLCRELNIFANLQDSHGISTSRWFFKTPQPQTPSISITRSTPSSPLKTRTLSIPENISITVCLMLFHICILSIPMDLSTPQSLACSHGPVCECKAV